MLEVINDMISDVESEVKPKQTKAIGMICSCNVYSSNALFGNFYFKRLWCNIKCYAKKAVEEILCLEISCIIVHPQLYSKENIKQLPYKDVKKWIGQFSFKNIG